MAFIMLVMMSNPVYAQTPQRITVDDFNFEVLSKNLKGVQLAYSDESGYYVFNLNKQNANGEAEIEISHINTLSRSRSVNYYQIYFDKQIEYTSQTQNLAGTILVDENTGNEYSLNTNSRFAFVIPVGIPLLAAAVEALLLVGGVIIIAGVAYTVVEEVAEELKKQKTYRYYAAALRNNEVYVGGALSTASAKALAYSNDKTGTVLATSFSYAKGLVGNSYRGPENHGSGSGYWDHIHAKNGTGSYSAHIWYL